MAGSLAPPAPRAALARPEIMIAAPNRIDASPAVVSLIFGKPIRRRPSRIRRIAAMNSVAEK